jgi:phenylacetate-CoA ligase
MRDFLKRLPIAESLIRRNPLYYQKFRRLLEETADAGLDERRALRSRMLDRTIAWSAKLPGYDSPGHDSPGYDSHARELGDFPILTKETLQARAAEFRAGRAGVPAMTGGSSGQPLQLLRSPASVTAEQATLDWLAAKADIDLRRCRIATLRGDHIKDPDDQSAPFWRYSGRQRLVLSSSHLSPVNFAAFEAELLAFRPDVMLTYPSSLELLTSLAEEHGSKLRWKLTISSSETMRPGLRSRAHAAFGCSLLDHYGMAERVSLAYSLEDGVYWFVHPYSATELVPDDTGEFRIIGSSFWNRAQPLIRYGTGDIALAPKDAGPDRLERITLGLEPFGGIGGRASEVLQLGNGARVYALAQVSRGVAGAATVQLLQQAPDLIQIVVVPDLRYSSDTLLAIRRNFYQKVPSSVRIEFDIRDAPYRLANGKAPVFVNLLDRG